MLLSEKYGIIWGSPEGCENYELLNFLTNLGFKKIDDIPENYSEYRLVYNVVNPYIRTFEIYRKYKTSDIVFKKDMEQIISNDFNNWINMSFVKEKFEIETSKSFDKNWNKYEPQPYISDYKFDKITPNFFVRVENLSEDISKIGFDFDVNFENHTNKVYSYSLESAKKIFEYYKKIFYIAKYDPFSFTKETLSDNDKIKFIHDIL